MTRKLARSPDLLLGRAFVSMPSKSSPVTHTLFSPFQYNFTEVTWCSHQLLWSCEKDTAWFAQTYASMHNYNHNPHWKGDHRNSIYCLFQHTLHGSDASRFKKFPSKRRFFFSGFAVELWYSILSMSKFVWPRNGWTHSKEMANAQQIQHRNITLDSRNATILSQLPAISGTRKYHYKIILSFISILGICCEWLQETWGWDTEISDLTQ